MIIVPIVMFGRLGDESEDQPRVENVGTDAIVAEQEVVPEEEPVEARLLGRDAELDEVVGVYREVGRGEAPFQGHRPTSSVSRLALAPTWSSGRTSSSTVAPGAERIGIIPTPWPGRGLVVLSTTPTVTHPWR